MEFGFSRYSFQCRSYSGNLITNKLGCSIKEPLFEGTFRRSNPSKVKLLITGKQGSSFWIGRFFLRQSCHRPIAHTGIQPARELWFRGHQRLQIQRKPISLAIVVLDYSGYPIFAQFVGIVFRVDGSMVGEFHSYSLLIPASLLCCKKGCSGYIGDHIARGKTPFGRKSVQHFNDWQITQGSQRANGNGSAIVTPHQRIRSYCTTAIL